MLFIEELQEGLEELVGSVVLKKNAKGLIVIHTNLIEREDGQLINLDDCDEEDEDDSEEFLDEEDSDFDFDE